MGIEDQDRLEKLRQRLYERGTTINNEEAMHELADEETPVATTWDAPPEPIEPVTVPVTEPVVPVENTTETSAVAATPVGGDTLTEVKKSKSYRWKIVLLGVLFFLVSVGFSSYFLFQGGNTISGENIDIVATGPFTIGGGEAIPVEINVANNNAVPINAATLIVEYPAGTQSVNDPGKELYTERLSLDTIASGETLKVPLRATVFGEEDEEKEIKTSIEYRVEGSNALFFKEADPLRFKIGSSPITLSVDNTIKLSSGQETEVTLVISSNSSNPIPKMLVTADYPNGFDFSESEPSPDYAENMWVIENLEPESSQEITISGIMVGRETDEYAINLAVGVPSERNPQTLSSVFVTDQIDFVIEQPFLDIDMRIAGDNSPEVAIEPDEQVGVVIEVQNTLEDSIYDASIVVELSGNALSDLDVRTQNGYYNSSNNTISWNVGNYDLLEQIAPGRSEQVSFSIETKDGSARTPQVNIHVKVEARRVSESRVAENLEGTADAVVKIISIPELAADVGYNNSVFSDYGAIPPIAEKKTSYTLSMMIQNGSNEINNAEVTASLPPYVEWLGDSSGSGDLTFNEVNRVITWDAGSIDGNSSAVISFQVSLLPSTSQIDTTPTLLGTQRMKATDGFTGEVVRTEHISLTTELSRESGYDPGNGRVIE